MKKIVFLSIWIILIISSCKTDIQEIIDNNIILSGNIQNGGYIIKHLDNYIYFAQGHLCLKDINDSTETRLPYNHYFYEMNLYNNEIYYTSSFPGAIWKVSVDGASQKKLINQKAGNLILYKDYMYYRLSEDNDWGKVYRADLNGENKQLLADKVICFSIYNDLIYYMDIYDNRNAICSMDLNGENIRVINYAYVNYLQVENGQLLYSDHNRDDRLFVYDLESHFEKCISEDKCWNINCNKDWIFYRNQSDSGRLYCINWNGNNKRKLVDNNITNIIVVDDRVFYININDENRVSCYDLRTLEGRQGDGSVVWSSETNGTRETVPSSVYP